MSTTTGSAIDPLKFLDNFVITPTVQTGTAAVSGFGNILNYFTMWVVALTGIITVFVLIPLVPKAPANLVIILSGIALAVGIWLHVNQFGAEYRLSTWQNNLQFYGSITLLMLVIFLSLGFYYYNTDPGVREAANSMVSRAQNSVSTGTRGFTNFAMSGSRMNAGTVA
jgi:hypothetical protein